MQLPDFALERFFARWEFEVPHLLCASDIEPFGLGEVLDLADDECRGLWAGLRLGYTDGRGHPLLRAEIASMYDGIDPEDVLVFAGAEEAIFAFMHVAMGTGDHLLVSWPGYQSLYEVARSLGSDVELLGLDREREWALDCSEFESRITPSTRAVVVNFPHNPTGTNISRTDFTLIVDACRRADVLLFSDEVYRLLEHDPSSRLPAAAEVYERGVSLGVMSKAFALAGLRIGWIVTRERSFLERLSVFKDYTTICSSAPSEVLALIALRARDLVLERNLSLVLENLDAVDGFMTRMAHAVEWVRPSAGCVGFPRLRTGESARGFAYALAEEEGVLLLPGDVFDAPGDHFRLGFGRRDAREALGRLERFAGGRLGAAAG